MANAKVELNVRFYHEGDNALRYDRSKTVLVEIIFVWFENFLSFDQCAQE